MKRVIHLSDLHFGRDRPELVKPLTDLVNQLAPDLVVISGDLTQRARRSQFQKARAFIDTLAPEVLVVPGNHDVPLYNVFRRFLTPFRRYRRWIDQDLQPVFVDDEILVVGINTVDPLSVQRGRVRSRALSRVRDVFVQHAQDRIRIIVAHHPLEHAPHQQKKIMRGADSAMAQFIEAGADMILSGHLHSWRAEPFAEQSDVTATLQIHAGTSLSDRTRGEENDFNLIEIDGETIAVTSYSASPTAKVFSSSDVSRFKTRSGWSGSSLS